MNRTIFSIIIILFSLNSYSQNELVSSTPLEYKKNSIDVTYGTFGFTGALTTSYYRFLLKKPKIINPFLKLGVGKQYGFSEDERSRDVYIINAGALVGNSKHHFECGIGIVNDFKKNGRYTDFLEPSGFLGYRIQNFESKIPFIFRSGLGYPETLYVGFGIAF